MRIAVEVLVPLRLFVCHIVPSRWTSLFPAQAAVILHQVVFSLEKHLTGGCEYGWKPSEKH